MAAGSAVLSGRNGPAPAPLFFVAEAPGYLGGVRTGVPLWGDQSGKRFRAYCAEAGLDLERAFISNAVLCHPPSADGRNRTPKPSEVHNCNDFLRALIVMVDPALVVALGRVALEAVARIAPQPLEFGRDVGVARPWFGRHLLSLYHPSGQTLGRRAMAQQVADYRAVVEWLANRVALAD